MYVQKRLSCTLVLVGAMLILAGFVPLGNAYAQGNSCALERTTVIGSRSFSVKLIIANTDTLAGFQIPFSFSYGDIAIQCDSISFWGGECIAFGFQDVKIDNANKRAYLSAINNATIDDQINPLAPGRHEIATAYFTVERPNPNGFIHFVKDTMPDEERDYSFLFWTPQAEEVAAYFNFGGLKLR